MDSRFFGICYNILTRNHVPFDRGKICSTILMTKSSKGGFVWRRVGAYRNEAVGTAQYTSGLRSTSKLLIFIDICRPIFYTTITSACRRLYNHNNWRHQLRDRPRSRPCKPLEYLTSLAVTRTKSWDGCG